MRGTISTMLLKFELASDAPGGVVKTQLAGPAPSVSHSGGPRWGLRIHRSNKF